MASTNPDFRYVDLPDEINLSDPAKDSYYAKNAVVVLPGLGTARSAQTVAVRGTRVAWGITLMNDAPNRANAVKFLQLLLSPTGTAMLKENGPAPIEPALVSRCRLSQASRITAASGEKIAVRRELFLTLITPGK